MKLCKNCAKEVEDKATICPHCGELFTQKKSSKVETSKKETKSERDKPNYMDNGIIRGPFNKIISLLLCVFLGWLGGHRFYERKYITGIIYACTFGLWGAGIVFDLIRLSRQPRYYYVTIIPFL